ncbi:unnamed protein product [Moneuplotes crassus]|uniref:Uncharacterized protein n=1 Tax=Euplotes crassus TaxID=5936 RepID=A0AAD1U2L9_EUPCR|nr:unnamed protein product [Moneuplotes crassus]
MQINIEREKYLQQKRGRTAATRSRDSRSKKFDHTTVYSFFQDDSRKYKPQEYFSPQTRKNNQRNMKTTHFVLGSDGKENVKRMSDSMSDPSQTVPVQSNQHIIMAKNSKKTHFKLSPSGSSGKESLNTTQRDSYKCTKSSGIAQSKMNAMKFKQTHFNFGFQKQSYHTSYNSINRNQPEVVKHIPNSTDNVMNQKEKSLELQTKRITKFYSQIEKLYGNDRSHNRKNTLPPHEIPKVTPSLTSKSLMVSPKPVDGRINQSGTITSNIDNNKYRPNKRVAYKNAESKNNNITHGYKNKGFVKPSKKLDGNLAKKYYTKVSDARKQAKINKANHNSHLHGWVSKFRERVMNTKFEPKKSKELSKRMFQYKTKANMLNFSKDKIIPSDTVAPKPQPIREFEKDCSKKIKAFSPEPQDLGRIQSPMNLVLKNMIAQEHFTIRNKNKAKIKKKVESTNFEIAHKTNVKVPIESSYMIEFLKKKQSGAAVKRVGIQPPSSLHLEHYDGNMPREFGNRTFAASRNPYGNIQRSTKTAQSQRSHPKPFQGHKQSLKTTKLDESIK